MKLPKSRWAGVAASAVIVASVAGITLGVMTLLGVTFQGSGEAQQRQGVADTPETRGLTICVQALDLQLERLPPGADLSEEVTAGDRALEEEAKSRIEASLDQLATHPRWDVSGLGRTPPVVATGCPSLPLPLITHSDVEWKDAQPEDPADVISAEYTDSTGEEFVYIMNPDLIDYLLGGLSVRTAPQEVICEGDVCQAKSYATYLTPAEIENESYLFDTLEFALGLGGP